MIILIKILLAHMLGDFLLQPTSWVEAKEERKLFAWQLYVHSLIHFVLIMILINDFTFWKWAVMLGISHLIIDSAKLLLQKKRTKRMFFFIDQGAHILLIILFWLWY
jgi:hypothetical protein